LTACSGVYLQGAGKIAGGKVVKQPVGRSKTRTCWIAEYDGSKPSNFHSRNLGGVRGQFRRKAVEMNLTRLRLRRWELEEIQLVKEHAGSEPLSTISKTFEQFVPEQRLPKNTGLYKSRLII